MRLLALAILLVGLAACAGVTKDRCTPPQQWDGFGCVDRDQNPGGGNGLEPEPVESVMLLRRV